MSTIVAELNRLAGTSGLEEQGAANAWAGTSGLATLGALNAKAGTRGLGLNAVCNLLAGTSGLDAQGALQVTVVGPTTGLSLPGSSGNYLSVPDSSDLDVIGDAAWMWDGILPDWTPATTMDFITKYGAAGARSFRFLIGSTGNLNLLLSANGTSTNVVGSGTPPIVSDGGALAVGATYRVSDQRVQFFTAPTGTTTHPGEASWTQLGTDKTNTQTAIFSGAANVEIGSETGGTANVLNGTTKRARIWASIDGTDQRLDVNAVGQTKTATRTPSTFTEAAKSATVTVNGSDWDWTTT